MKELLVGLLVFTFQRAVAQEWHSAGERLSEPKSPSHFYVSASYLAQYDSVPCMYMNFSSGRLRKGFKVVYVHNGYFTDDSRTYRVFLDERFRRIYDVRRYYFK